MRPDLEKELLNVLDEVLSEGVIGLTFGNGMKLKAIRYLERHGVLYEFKRAQYRATGKADAMYEELKRGKPSLMYRLRIKVLPFAGRWALSIFTHTIAAVIAAIVTAVITIQLQGS